MSTTTIRKHVVWLCAGCADCEPLDGSEPSQYPCERSDSANGADVFECGPVLDLLERAYSMIRRAEVRIDADCSPKSPLTTDIEALLRANGRLT